MNSIDIYVVRRNSKDELRDSAPCVDCYNTMKEYGVRNIIYSSDGGEIVKLRLKDYVPKTISLGRRFINNGYKMIKKEKCVIQ